MGAQVSGGLVEVLCQGRAQGYGYGTDAKEYWLLESGVPIPLDFDCTIRQLPPAGPFLNDAQILSYLTALALAGGLQCPLYSILQHESSGWIAGEGWTFDVLDEHGVRVGVWTMKFEDSEYYREAAMVDTTGGRTYPFNFTLSLRRIPADPFVGIAKKSDLFAKMADYLGHPTNPHSDVRKVQYP